MQSKNLLGRKRESYTVDRYLLSRGDALPTYGSLSSHNTLPRPQKKKSSPDSLARGPEYRTERSRMSTPGSETPLRVISATEVVIPPTKWYKRLYIPFLVRPRPPPFSNVIHTTKYTVLNFLPKNLWEQFHRAANIYFLFIIILNFIPDVEAVGKEVAWIPLFFILCVTAAKDIFEDYRRYKSDRTVNNLLCHVYDR